MIVWITGGQTITTHNRGIRVYIRRIPMKRVLLVSLVATFFLTFSGLDLAWSKAHVPLDHVQVCRKSARSLTARAVNATREEGAALMSAGLCRLPACDFANVFPAASVCPNVDENGDGFCDLENPRNDAVNLTAACTNEY
jgi:hypothetical protein